MVATPVRQWISMDHLSTQLSSGRPNHLQISYRPS